MLTRSYGTLLTLPTHYVQYYKHTVYALVREIGVQLPEFQRELIVPHMERIRDSYRADPSIITESAIKFGTISSLQNKKPVLYLVDGQHRFQALKQLVDEEGNPAAPVSSTEILFAIRFCKSKNELLEYYARLNRNTPMEHFVMRMIEDIPTSNTSDEQTTEFTIYNQFSEFMKLYKPYFSDSVSCLSPNVHFDTFMRYWKESTKDYFGESDEAKIVIRTFMDMKELFCQINDEVRYHYERKLKEKEELQAAGRRITKMHLTYEKEYNAIMDKYRKSLELYKKKYKKTTVSQDEFPPFYLGTPSNALIELQRHRDGRYYIRIPKWEKVNPNTRDQINTRVWAIFAEGKPTMPCPCCKKRIIAERAHESYEQCEYGHIVSERYGGDYTEDNLRPVCRSCNSNMRAIHMDEYMSQLNSGV